MTFPFPFFVPDSLVLVSSITFIGAETDNGTSMEFEGTEGFQAGDIWLWFDVQGNTSGTPSSVVPSGFTQISNVNFSGTGDFRTIIAYKIAQPGDIGTTITGMSGGDVASKLLLCFRPDVPINTIQALDASLVFTDGNPSAQVVNASGNTSPLIVYATYRSSGTVNPTSFSPTQDGTEAGLANHQVKYKIYNSSPADVTVDMDDEGTSNQLGSGYILVT